MNLPSGWGGTIVTGSIGPLSAGYELGRGNRNIPIAISRMAGRVAGGALITCYTFPPRCTAADC